MKAIILSYMYKRTFSKFVDIIQNSVSMNYFFQPQLAGIVNVHNKTFSDNENECVFDLVVLKMGVPKSKITPERKKRKEGRYVAQKVGWYVCKKCGEPKRPHRICSKNFSVCSIKDKIFEKMKN